VIRDAVEGGDDRADIGNALGNFGICRLHDKLRNFGICMMSLAISAGTNVHDGGRNVTIINSKYNVII